MTTRPIDNSDLWAAVRGLGMFSMPLAELEEAREHHASIDMFASQVIAEAAGQVLAIRRRGEG